MSLGVVEAVTKPIIFVGGGKGGVGKSTVTMGVLDYLRTAEQAAVLIETDTSAPDVWKTYHEHLVARCVDLETEKGWLELVDVFGEHPDSYVVINTKAANQAGMRKFGGLLAEAIRQQNRKLLVLWVIDRKRDGLELLRDFLDTQPANDRMTVHVLRNLIWGEEASFDMYNGSQVRGAIEGSGGKSANFPDVAERVAEEINRKRMPIHIAAKELSFGCRVELIRWRTALAEALAEIVT